MKRLYLAGPMRGYPAFNFPAFHKAAGRLRQEGFYVFSPAEADEEEYGKTTADWGASGNEDEAAKALGMSDTLTLTRECFLRDTDWICRYADAVALMPGWELSSGARAEKALAEAIGLSVIFLGKGYV